MKNILIASAMLAGVSIAAPASAEEASSFSGPTIAVLAGYDHVALKAGGVSEGKSGFAYGAAIGYDFDLGSIVVGGEAEAMGSTTDYSAGGASLSADRDLYAGVRAGYKVASNVLLYAKGGYTNARAKASFGGLSGSDELDGYRLGAGAEVAYGKWFGRVEYRYSDYGQYQNTGVSVDRNQVVAGFGYRF